jgi:hypothetical protein
MDFDNDIILRYTHIFAYRADINERFGPCEAPIDITPGRAPIFNRPNPNRMFKTNKPDTLLLPIIENIIIIILVLSIIDCFITKKYLSTILIICLLYLYLYLLKIY